jgi:tetratricopeptide (TPR) repeat protein
MLAVLLVGLTVVSCSRAPEEDLFAKAETLYLDQQYDDAIGLFKRFLLEHPDHAGAHFYLGTCYYASDENRWLGIAQGELETAITLFERQGKVSSIPRFNATYFELIGHINLAKIYRELVFTIVEDAPRIPGFDRRRAVELALEKCDEQYEIVKRIHPDNPDVVWLKGEIDTLRDALSIPRRPVSPPASQI